MRRVQPVRAMGAQPFRRTRSGSLRPAPGFFGYARRAIMTLALCVCNKMGSDDGQAFDCREATASGAISPARLLASRSGRPGARTAGLNHHRRAGMKHWHFGLLAAAAAFFVTSSRAGGAQLSRHPMGTSPGSCPDLRFRLGGGRPIPSNYRVLTPPLAELPRRSARKGPVGRVTAAARSNRL